jgi:hypothetical protein
MVWNVRLSRVVLANVVYNLGPLTELYLCVVWGTRIAGARYFLAAVLVGGTLAFMVIAGLQYAAQGVFVHTAGII